MKNKTRLFFTFAIITTWAILIVFYSLLLFVFNMSKEYEILVACLVSALAALMFAIFVFSYIYIRKKREDIKDSFDFYVENQVSHEGIGVIIFNSSYDIIWTSEFIEKRMGRNIIGKPLESISKGFKTEFEQGKKNFRFEVDAFTFEARTKLENKLVVIKDVTNEERILKQYISEKLVVGELEIDNFQQFQVSLSEEEQFKLQSKLIKTLDGLSDRFNLFYKQYINGKYLFVTDEKSLNLLVAESFSFLDEIRKEKLHGGSLSVSIGIGAGTTSRDKLQELARDGLKQAQARGGDQVAVMYSNKHPQYYGSKFELAQVLSRVKIRKITNLFESKLKDPNIKKVVVYGHFMADLDAIGAALGITEIAKKYKKEVYIGNQTFDKTTTDVINSTLNKEEQSMFIKKSKATKLTTKTGTLVVIVDTAEISRIENPDALKNANKENVFIFDHHRIFDVNKEIPSSNVYIDSTASSTCEIIVEVINFLSEKIKLSKSLAQFILNGIYLDTASFTKSVSSRTFEAAAFLEKRGALSSTSSDILKIPENASLLVNQIMNGIQEVKPGYFLSYYDGEVPDDVISMAADEILRTQGRKASFVVAKSTSLKGALKMSARGVETNVQKIAEAVGGGGHFGASAAVSREPLAIFVDNIRHAIVSDKGEA